MFKNKQWLSPMVVALALLAAAALWEGILTGTAAAQGAQPAPPGPAWHRGMMRQGMMGCGMMHQGMMGCGMMGCPMPGQSLTPSAAVTTLDTVPTNLPESFPAALASADVARGQQLTLSSGCAGCHSLDANQIAVGPTWHDLAKAAAARVSGQNATQYLYTSIVQPNAYIVQGYQPNVMVQVYGQTFEEQDLAAIVKYLLTLHE